MVNRLAMARPEIAFTLHRRRRGRACRLEASQGDLLESRLARLAGVMGREFAAECAADRRRARGHPAHRLCRRADAQPRHRGDAVSLRQRPPGAGPSAGRRGARRLSGFPGARPPSAGGAVPRHAGRRGRRQRASGQGRGALPRCRAGARPHRRRAEPRSGRRRPPRLDHRRRRRHWARFRAAARRADAAGGGAAALRPIASRWAAIGRRDICLLGWRSRRPPTRRRWPRLWTCRRARARPKGPRKSRSTRAAERLIRSAPRARSCTRPTSWRRPRTASSSSTSTPRMSGWSTSA